jgi:membrane fusion protein (multidrug efflux system)
VVKVSPVKQEELKQSYTLVGEVATHGEIIIQPRINGRLLEVLVKEGDAVSAGQLLAVIDDQTIRLQLQQAESNIAVIKANLNQARLHLAQAKAEKERYKELLMHRYISQHEYDNVENAYLAALTSMEIQKEQLSSAEKNRELLQIQMEQTKIYSPIDGYVLAKEVTGGMNLTTGTQMLTVAPLSPIEIRFSIDQKKAMGIKKGTPVEFVTDALPDRVFRGTIDQTAAIYDANTRTMSFSVLLENKPALLEPGIFGTVEIILGHKVALAFPQEALVTVDGQNGIYVVDEGLTTRFKPVETGIIANGMIEAVSGLAEGDPVVVIGQNNLRVGQKVEVLNTEADQKTTTSPEIASGRVENQGAKSTEHKGASEERGGR